MFGPLVYGVLVDFAKMLSDNICFRIFANKRKDMTLATVTTKGQITIPQLIRNRLRLKTGDKVFFEERQGRIYIANASQVALSEIQKQMKGEAEKAGFQSEDDVISYIKELRASR